MLKASGHRRTTRAAVIRCRADHRCRARSAHRTRNLKFVLRTYANPALQRVHRVSKRLHKTCAKPPKTPSSEKSGFFAFFVTIVSSSTAFATFAGARQLAPTPAEGRCPTPTVGLVGASPCGTRPNVARPQPTQRVSDARRPASIHVDRERNQVAYSTPRRARRVAPFAANNASPVTAKWAIGDRRCVCRLGVEGAKPRSHAPPFNVRCVSRTHLTPQASALAQLDHRGATPFCLGIFV